jgi:16S rRNA (cytosine967-C5)-methyltransferase
MRNGARAQTAMDILREAETSHRPPALVLKDWAKSHRFAGARDRSEIGDLVFSALRWRASSSWRMGSDDVRAWVLGALRWGYGLSAEAVGQLAYDGDHAFTVLTSEEVHALECRDSLEAAPAWVRAEVPEWLESSIVEAFGEDADVEGQALAAPAALDLRVNTLKAQRATVLDDLLASPSLHLPDDGSPAAFATPHAPNGIRLPWQRGRNFGWPNHAGFLKGQFEVQDEGSQLVASLCGPLKGKQVADVCAGGGGKTLALAAAMEGSGQIFAYDVAPERLSRSLARIDRSGAHNIQMLSPRRDRDVLEPLVGKMDLVLVDAPCTGSGTWRRAPDSKWRLKPRQLETRLAEQQQALRLAAPLVKDGGLLAYVTCSVLPQENDGALDAFLTGSGFSPVAQTDVLAGSGVPSLADAVRFTRYGLLMTPARTGTDGFFFALLKRI